VFSVSQYRVYKKEPAEKNKDCTRILRRKVILVAWIKEDIALKKKMGKVLRYSCGVQCVLSATGGDMSLLLQTEIRFLKFHRVCCTQ